MMVDVDAAELKKILTAIDAGEFDFSVALEDIHMNVEKLLTDRIGAAGGRLHTGRSNQIRCQLARRRCPILGDGKYGSSLRTGEFALWSAFLAFEHPARRERMEFSALPQGAFWERFDYCTQAQV